MSFDGLRAALVAEVDLVETRLLESGARTATTFLVRNNDRKKVAAIQVSGVDAGLTMVTIDPILRNIQHYDAFRNARWRHPEDPAIRRNWDHPKGWTKYFSVNSETIADEVVEVLRLGYSVDDYPIFEVD